jgi:hypothetical protein
MVAIISQSLARKLWPNAAEGMALENRKSKIKNRKSQNGDLQPPHLPHGLPPV